MTTSKLLKYLTYGLVLQSATLPAFADAGIPTIIAIWPMGWILLIAIIPIEAKIAEKILKIPPWKGLEISGRANFVSTLAGVPITWFLLVISELMLGGGSRRIGHVASTTDWIFRSIIEGPVLSLLPHVSPCRAEGHRKVYRQCLHKGTTTKVGLVCQHSIICIH